MKREFTLLFFVFGLLRSSSAAALVCADKTDTTIVALKEVKGQSTNLSKYLSKKLWDQLFPHRAGKGPNTFSSKQDDFYSFKAFVAAARKFPQFLGEGPDSLRRRELAAFLAHVAQETSGAWEEAPGGYQAWGLYYKEEQHCQQGCPAYSVVTIANNYPPVAGKSYHGRGPLQLSYNYQYGQFSEAYFGDKQVLLNNPDMLTEDPVLAFSSAIWFWMTPQAAKPSCHHIMNGTWVPTATDIAKGRLPGFGATLNVINGGVECGRPPLKETQQRYDYYRYFCRILKVSPGENVECTDERPFTEQ